MVLNRDNLILYSNDPIDKIIYIETKTVDIPAFDYNDITFAHELGFRPLIMGEYSEDSDFSTSNTIGSQDTSFLIETAINADSTNVIISTNNNSGSAVTLYYRVYGFAEEDIDVDIEPTSGISGNLLQFDSSLNYAKLFDYGTTDTVSAGGGTATISHNLGRLTQIRVWSILSGSVTPLVASDLNQGIWAQSNANTLVLGNESLNDRTFHYRIYYDD